MELGIIDEDTGQNIGHKNNACCYTINDTDLTCQINSNIGDM